ncbi:hypothetical protein FS749_015815 [Ceratobasidium sp. UAMH 11750]|nr:hypothetical protein FS749_015815 [Ceratobasidium sp. UAMH 11750]
MPKSLWLSDEAVWIKKHLPQWQSVRGRSQAHLAIDGPSPRSRFLSQLVTDLTVQFPARAWSPGTDHGFPSSAEYHADLRQKLVEWLNNRCRAPGGAACALVPKIRPNVTGRQLAMSTHKPAITARAAEIRAEASDMNTRTAWNLATTDILNDMKVNDPSGLEALEDQA